MPRISTAKSKPGSAVCDASGCTSKLKRSRRSSRPIDSDIGPPPKPSGPRLSGDLQIEGGDIALRGQQLAADGRVAKRRRAKRTLRAKGVDVAVLKTLLDARQVDVPAAEGVVDIVAREGQRRAVLETGRHALSRQQQPLRDRAHRVAALPGRRRQPVGDAALAQAIEVLRRPAGDPERAALWHEHAHRRRALPCHGFVLRAQVLDPEHLAGRDPYGSLRQPGALLVLRQQVQVAHEVVAAARAVRRRDRLRRRTAASQRGVEAVQIAGECRRASAKARHAAICAAAHAAPGEAAVLRSDALLAAQVERAGNVQAVRGQVAVACGERDIGGGATVLLRLFASYRQLHPLQIAFQDEVDDAGDRAAAVDRRRAFAQHLDAIDQRHRDGVQIDRTAVVGMVRQSPAIQQHQCLGGPQAAQVDFGHAAGEFAHALRQALVRLVGSNAANRLLGGLHTRACQLVGADDGYRG